MTYENSTAHLLDELERIERLLNRFQERPAAETFRTGLSVTDADVSAAGTTALTDLEYDLPESDREDLHERAELLGEKRQAASENGVELRFATLVDAFDLTAIHRDVLLLSLLPDVEPAASGLYARLRDDTRGNRPTVGLLADIFARTPGEFVTALELFAEESPLVDHDLLVLEPLDDVVATSKLDYAVRVDDRVYDYLLGGDGVDPRLRAHLEAHASTALECTLAEQTAEATLSDLLVDEERREELANLPKPDDRGRRVYFHGPEGAGTHRAVEALCQVETFLQVDLRAVLAADALDAVVREAKIQSAPVHLTHAYAATVGDRENDHSLEAVVDRFASLDADLFVTGRSEWTPSRTQRASVDAIREFDRPTIALRREFWSERAPDLPDDLDAETMASTFDLTQGQLEAALASAQSLAGGDDLTVEDVRAGCRAQSSDALADLAQHVEPDVTWDDIRLSEETRRQIETLQTHITNRGLIYDDWGFREKDGNAGVVALFKGLPGTGKTMAAEVLANAVGMDIFKIDLSSVVSKYIGETEENLEQIFQAAEQSNAILLFDEADSVFGDRAEVSDATDRYANVEVNYLLQRVETYDGIILLTTNYAQNIDQAFARRITHSVHFDKPDADTREAIWETIFPETTPLEDIDTAWLAEFDYSGGGIDKLAKQIAIYAAEQGTERISMRHVVEALEQHKREQNDRIREKDFEPYLEYLDGPTEREEKEQIQQARRGQ